MNYCAALQQVINRDSEVLKEEINFLNEWQKWFFIYKKIDLVNYIFKSQLINAEDYKQTSKSAKETIINLSKIAKKNIENNFKIYE